MDLHRVGLIDASGAMVLSLVDQRLRERGIALLLSGLGIDDGHGRALSEFVGDALPPDHWYPDADRAVEAAEVDALRRATGGSVAAAVPLQRSSLMVGLDAGQCERVARRLVVQRLAPGERLFDQGDAGDRLYVLTEGSISVLGNAVAGDRTGLRVRFVTCSPGMMLGEIAMLDHRGRSAEAVADIDSVVHALDDAALHALWVEEPALAALVYRNIAVHLSTRLRIASNISGCTPGRQLTGGTPCRRSTTLPRCPRPRSVRARRGPTSASRRSTSCAAPRCSALPDEHRIVDRPIAAFAKACRAG